MTENQPVPVFENFDAARGYVDEVRDLYRKEEGEYRGRRTPEQQMIAEYTSEEARLIVDGVMAGMLALGATTLPEDYDEVSFGNYDWNDFRSEFSRLLVGFGVLTNRLHRDGFIQRSFSNFGEPDKMKVASVLFTDFLKHNALRSGVDSAGVMGIKTVREHNLHEGTIEEKKVIRDKDKARDDREVQRNIKVRGFSTALAAHSAGKMSPEQVIELRRAYPEMDADAFYRDVSFYTNAKKEFEARE